MKEKVKNKKQNLKIKKQISENNKMKDKQNIENKKNTHKKNIKKRVFSEKIKSQLFLLQGYYNYLYLGKFMEQIIMYNDLSVYAQNIRVPTGDETTFMLNGNTLKDKLKLISQNPGKKNIFGYFVELSSFRGVMGVMNELLETEGEFTPFIEKILGSQYFSFVHIIKFARNVLMHATSSQLSLDINAFDKHRSYLVSQDKPVLKFYFNYAKKINGRSGSEDYSVKVNIDFTKMYSGKSFWKVISIHQLYLLCELCYNLTLVYIKSK